MRCGQLSRKLKDFTAENAKTRRGTQREDFCLRSLRIFAHLRALCGKVFGYDGSVSLVIFKTVPIFLPESFCLTRRAPFQARAGPFHSRFTFHASRLRFAFTFIGLIGLIRLISPTGFSPCNSCNLCNRVTIPAPLSSPP